MDPILRFALFFHSVSRLWLYPSAHFAQSPVRNRRGGGGRPRNRRRSASLKLLAHGRFPPPPRCPDRIHQRPHPFHPGWPSEPYDHERRRSPGVLLGIYDRPRRHSNGGDLLFHCLHWVCLILFAWVYQGGHGIVQLRFYVVFGGEVSDG